MRRVLVVAQAGTFFALGALLALQGNYRLGASQVMLGVINFLIYI